MKLGTFYIQVHQGLFEFQVVGPGVIRFLDRRTVKPGQVPQRCWVLGGSPRVWPQAPLAYFYTPEAQGGKLSPRSQIPRLGEFLTALEEHQTWDIRQALDLNPFLGQIQNLESLLGPAQVLETLETLPVVGTHFSPWEPEVFRPWVLRTSPKPEVVEDFLYTQRPFFQAEPENPRDPQALAVYVGHRKKPGLTKMGYVKKNLAQDLRRRFPRQRTFPADWAQIKAGPRPGAWDFTLRLQQTCPSF